MATWIIPVAISVNRCRAIQYVNNALTRRDELLPEERFMSLEISLLHLSIDAKSEALSVDSWSSTESTLTGYDCLGDSGTDVGSVCMATSDVNRGLFNGNDDWYPRREERCLLKNSQVDKISEEKSDERYPLSSPVCVSGNATSLELASEAFNATPHKMRPLLYRILTFIFPSKWQNTLQGTSTILLPWANHYSQQAFF